METSKVNNKNWNGEDSAFLRCISSVNKSFYDVPIMYGSDGGLYDKMCESASLFVKSIMGNDDYMDFDYWMRFNVDDGRITASSKKSPIDNDEEWCLSGVCGVESLYFKGDINTLLIEGVAIPQFNSKIFSDIRKLFRKGVVKDKHGFVSDYNEEISKSTKWLQINDADAIGNTYA